MGIVGATDKILRIYKDWIIVLQLFKRNRIHVVYIHNPWDLPTFDAEVSPLIPDDDLLFGFHPFPAMVEYLVQIPFIAEQFFSDYTVKP